MADPETIAYQAWAIRFSNALSSVSPDERLNYAKEVFGQMPEPPREAYQLLFFAGVNNSEMVGENWKKAERIYLMSFAVATLIFLATAAFLIPEPKPFQFFIFRLISSLCAGGVGAFLPGSLSTSVERPSFVVKAGGALALAVIVWFVNPPTLAGGH